MGHLPHLSRREILNAIPALLSGAILMPLRGEPQSSGARAIIRGALRDGATGKPVAAKLRVTSAGEVFLPAHAIHTMPRTPQPYFYARGSYEIAVPPGRYDIEVVRGICHQVVTAAVEAGAGITRVHDFNIPVLRDLRASGWYSGNTHTHYHLDLDADPDDHLRL